MPETAFLETGSFGPVLDDAEFEFIRHVVGENAGIVLGPNKRQLVQGRLGRRLRDLGLHSYREYCEHVRRSGPEELVALINALTTTSRHSSARTITSKRSLRTCCRKRCVVMRARAAFASGPPVARRARKRIAWPWQLRTWYLPRAGISKSSRPTSTAR